MAIEKKNINIPISGGVNQGEDGYLLKPPFLEVINGWYDKAGSIKKRGAYQFLQAGFSSSASPFVLRNSLHVVDGDVLSKWVDPSTSSTRTLSADTTAIPSQVDTLPSENDGAFEVVAAANGSTVTVVWSQPVPPDPDSADTEYKKHLDLYVVQYDESDMTSPTAGPFRLTNSGARVDLEELSLVYTGGYWCISGISRSDSTLYAAITASFTSGALTWQLVSSDAIDHYDVTFVSGATALYYVLQYQNDTTSTTAASRSWGYTEGVSASIGTGGTLTLNRIFLGVIGASDNYVGDKAVAIHAKGSVLWIAVASVRHDVIYAYTTDLSFGSKSAATAVHTHALGEPWVNGNWGGFLTGTKGSRAYPYYEDQQSVVPTTVDGTWGTDFGGGNDRVGRLCFASTTSGVRLFWDGPIIKTSASDYWGGSGLGTWPSLWGVAWKTITDGLSVSSSMGAAPASYLASKPRATGDESTLVLGISSLTRWTVGNPLSPQFAPKNSAKGMINNWSFDQADKPASWRMGQLCTVSGLSAVPVSQFGADLLVGREWGLKDAARLYTKGTDEPPQVSTRRMEYLFETANRSLVFGAAYLVRGGAATYERPGPAGFSYASSMDAHMCKAVVVSFQQALSPRSTAVTVGEEAYLSNGWLSVYDGNDIREASPNFIPPEPEFGGTGSPGDTYGAQVSWFVVDKSNRLLRTSRGPVATNSNTPTTITLFGAPPSYASAGGRTRFEIWGTTDTSSSPYLRFGVGDPASFSTNGPYIFTQRFINGYGEVAGSASELQPEPIGGSTYVTATSNRVWYVEPEDTARVRFSKDFSVLGRVEFNRNLYVDIPDGSRPVAVANLDEQVVIFTDKSIYLVTGNLPNNSGGGANFYLQRVAFESGCSNRYSVFSTRHGVFFESHNGLNLLTRGYEVLFAGEAIEDSVSGGSSITGTAYLPAYDLYLFTTSTDIMVLQVGDGFRWTRWDFEHDQDIVASCAWGDYHVILGSEGNLFYMDMDVVTDVLMTLTTPWIYFGELEGFQRIRNISLVGRNDTVSPTGYAAVQIGYDFAPSYAETLFYEYGVDITGDPMRIRLKPARGKCSSFRLRFAETAETTGQSVTNDAALTIAGISVEAGIKMLGIKNSRNPTSTPS
jgi:hypothetical protein